MKHLSTHVHNRVTAILLCLSLQIPILISQTCPATGTGSTSTNCDCDLPTTPVKKVRFIIHIFYNSLGQNNIPDNTSGNAWINGVVADANSWMRNLLSYSSNPSASVTDSRIEYDLVGIYR